MKKILISLLLLILATSPSMAQTLRGVVSLNDSTPCGYATVYIPSINRGIAANEKGEYLLDELPVGELKVEYSCMGQQTVRREVTLTKGDTLVNNEMLSEKLMLLPPSIVTVDGESPAQYVLRHVWDKADENRNRIDTWQAELKYELGMNDLEIFLHVIPKKFIVLLKTAATLSGFRKFLNLVLDHPSLKAKVSLLRTYANGKAKDSEQKLLYCSEKLTQSEQEILFNNKLAIEPNLFDEVYDPHEDWGRKGEMRDKFELVGSYELDGKMIDVLECITKRTRERTMENEAGEKEIVNKIITTTTKLHVVEDDWGILKMETDGERIHGLLECRDLGSGIYMPISSSMRLKLPTIPASKIQEGIEKYEQGGDDSDKANMSKSERKMFERFIDELKKHKDRDLEIDLYFAYDIKYRYFKVK